jgi:dTDP-glucose 4,6-dehydratase
VGARNEQTNRALAERVLALIDGPAALGSVTDRLGHDRRYALDPSKLEGAGWSAVTPWDSGFAATVRALSAP